MRLMLRLIFLKVVPYIGTWIETVTTVNTAIVDEVVPYIGTWIETGLIRIKGCKHLSYLI